MPNKTKAPNGFIFYQGPSMLDGAPIVAIACSVNGKPSKNAKTGAMVQTFILRADVPPLAAVNSGDDYSICGDCPHRGTVIDGKNKGRSCYVAVWQAPRAVYDGFTRGIYPTPDIQEGAGFLRGKTVRLGSYGDPAAVPFDVWKTLLSYTAAKTGYTHQWRLFPALRAYCMASCDNPQDFAEAKAQGWRTFRVRLAGEELMPREIVCPASKEAGTKTSCALCRACGGHTAKARVDVAIIAHGAVSKTNAFNSYRNA